MTEAKKLDLLDDEQMYDMFLFQVTINSWRLFSLRDSKLDILAFRISCYLKNEYFPIRHTDNLKFKSLEKALDDMDFFHYLLAVMKNRYNKVVSTQKRLNLEIMNTKCIA